MADIPGRPEGSRNLSEEEIQEIINRRVAQARAQGQAESVIEQMRQQWLETFGLRARNREADEQGGRRTATIESERPRTRDPEKERIEREAKEALEKAADAVEQFLRAETRRRILGIGEETTAQNLPREVLGEMLNQVQQAGRIDAATGEYIPNEKRLPGVVVKNIYNRVKDLTDPKAIEENLLGARKGADGAVEKIPGAVGDFNSYVELMLTHVGDADFPMSEEEKEEFRQKLEYLHNITSKIKPETLGEVLTPAQVPEFKRVLEEVVMGKDIVDTATGKTKHVNGMKDVLASYEVMRGTADPRCLEDLCRLIMNQEEEQWKIGGKQALLKENERGELKADLRNFLAWVRSRIWYYHDFSPDTKIQLFSDINIPTLFRNISLFEMIYFAKYFNEEKLVQTPKRDREGRLLDTEGRPIVDPNNQNQAYGWTAEYHTNKEYQRLRDRNMLFEVWLFDTSHNNDATYRQTMYDGEKLLETLMNVHMLDQFTKDKYRMQLLLNMPSIDKRHEDEFEEILTEEGQMHQGSVGMALQAALVTWYHSVEFHADYEKDRHGNYTFRRDANGNRIMQADLPRGTGMIEQALKPEGMKQFYKSIISQILEEKCSKEVRKYLDIVGKNEEDYQNAEKGDPNYNYLSTHRTLYDVMLEKLGKEGFKDFFRDRVLRQFNTYVDKDGKTVNLPTLQDVKLSQGEIALLDIDNPEEFALALMKKWLNREKKDFNVFDKPTASLPMTKLTRNAIQAALAKTYDLSKADARHASEFAFSFTYWSGISATNDTKGDSHDALNKMVRTEDRRRNQIQGRGTAGNKYNIPGIKRISNNMREEMMTKDEYSDTFDKS